VHPEAITVRILQASERVLSKRNLRGDWKATSRLDHRPIRFKVNAA
jgi:hypothetical protein